MNRKEIQNQNIGRRDFLRTMACGAVALAAGETFLGCGGGSGKVSPMIAPVDRMVVLDLISQKLTGLSGLDAQTASQQMAQFLSTQPLIQAAGVSQDGSAWGVFKDGTLLTIVNNRQPSSVSKSAIKGLTRGTADQLPSSTNAFVFNSLGDFDPKAGTAATQSLPNQNYTLETDATIEGFKSVQNADVFVLDSHGNFGLATLVKRVSAELPRYFWTATNYCLVTASHVTTDALTSYWQDYYNGLLCIACVYIDQQKTWGFRFGITAKFVERYMSFSTNSFVFINACLSSHKDFASLMRQAFLNKGASVYAGWTDIVGNPSADNAETYLLQHLLGEDTSFTVLSKLGALNYIAIKAQMHSSGLDISPVGTQIIYAGQSNAELTFTTNDPTNGNFGLLAPSIASVATLGGNLVLTGLFGSNPKTVLLLNTNSTTEQGTPVSSGITWNSTSITFPLPSSGNYVKVVADGRASNIVSIVHPPLLDHLVPVPITIFPGGHASVKAVDAAGDAIPANDVTWTSNNTGVTVPPTGNPVTITAALGNTAPYNAIVSATQTSTGKKHSVSVTVVGPLYQLIPPAGTIGPNDIVQITAEDQLGNNINGSDIVWSSSSTQVLVPVSGNPIFVSSSQGLHTLITITATQLSTRIKASAGFQVF